MLGTYKVVECMAKASMLMELAQLGYVMVLCNLAGCSPAAIFQAIWG
jgi:hypothetical protein